MKLDNYNQISLGKMLKEARFEKNITIEELSVITKIHKRLIQTLEKDDFLNFPNRVYIIGFLKSMSEELGFNLDEAIGLYEMQSWKNKQRHIPDVIEDKPIPDKTVIFHLPFFFKKNIKIKLKWLVPGCLLLALLIIISPLLFEMNRPVEMEASTKVGSHKYKNRQNINNNKPNRKIAYIQGPQKVSITAKNGNSWISFSVDKNPVRQLTLRKGSSIILSGDKIRLTVGNFKALEVKSNNVVVNNFKSNKNKTASISFPQKNIARKGVPELVLGHDVIRPQTNSIL
jgi:transcriptional regulator with XRE-family HTH domain